MLRLKLRKLAKSRLVILCALLLIVTVSSFSLYRIFALKVESSNYTSSSVTDETVFVNDLDADWNYYTGLNFTTITNNVVPTGSNLGLYDENNLVPVIITYSGVDINDESLVGKVSPSEGQYQYKYYKYYPLVDGKITIELIDNPFSARPTGKGFNGWSTDYEGAVLSYDDDYYLRYVTVPATSTSVIDITMHASWVDANIQTGSSNNLENLDEKGMKAHPSIPVYEERIFMETQYSFMAGVTYYEVATVARRNYYTGYVDEYGNGTYTYVNNAYCNTRTGCEYYKATTDTVYNADKEYYTFTSTGGTNYTMDNPTVYQEDEVEVTREVIVGYQSPYSAGDSLVSLYYKTDINGDRSLYYDSVGVSCSISSNCSSGNTYKLLQVGDAEATWTDTADITNYYYLVTRDMNILYNFEDNANLSDYMSTKPYTLSGSYNGAAITGNILNVDSANILNDMVIENMELYGTRSSTVSETISTDQTLSAGSYNLKIGRNVTNSRGTNYKIFNGIYGVINDTYTGSETNPDKFTVIVESGVYNYLLSGNARNMQSTNIYIQAKYIYGSDYDRANGDDSKLKVYFNALASARSNYNSGTSWKTVPSSAVTIKSGRYGKTANNAYSTDSATGVYVGGRSTTHYSNSLRTLKIEGGDINVVNGGPCVEASYLGNSVALYMTGGTVRSIYGGAANTATYGNRIISVTGGNVTNNIFGGSNSYNGSSNEGTLYGDTLIYVGGDAEVGGATGTLFNASPGSVFGGGAGRAGDAYVNLGTVNSAHVIIDGEATILGDVYGGGNYGSTGKLGEEHTTTIIDLIGGTINGNVFGSSNNNGSGKRGVKDYINVAGINYYQGKSSVSVGEVIPTTYSYQLWTGSETVTKTYETYLYDDSQVQANTICTTDNVSYNSNTNQCVFAFQVVPKGTDSNTYDNSECQNNYCPYYIPDLTTVDFVDGRWHLPNDVDTKFGDEAHTIYVNINGSKILSSVYGGANSAGTVFANVVVNMTAGNVASEVFGGGKGQNTYVSGTVNVVIDGYNGDTSVYGGSEEGVMGFTPEDNVSTDKNINVTLKDGFVTNIFGGSKGTTAVSPLVASKVTVLVSGGEATNVYGGNNLNGDYSYSPVVYLKGGVVESAYGGSNNTGMAKIANVYLDGGTATNIFGGSNVSGETIYNQVYLISGTVTNAYGGNNAGGTAKETYVLLKGGNVTYAYGCGKGSGTTCTTTHVKIDGINGADLTTVFGGGQAASVTEKTNVVLLSGSVLNIFGGSNTLGEIPLSNVYVSDGTATNVFGGNNEGGTTTLTNVKVGGGTVTNVYGGGEQATTETSNVLLFKGNVTSAFGGGHMAGVSTSNVKGYGGNVTNIFGGSNQNGTVTTSNVDIESGTDSSSDSSDDGSDSGDDDTSTDDSTDEDDDGWESTYEYKDVKINYTMSNLQYNRLCSNGNYACGYTYAARVTFSYTNPYDVNIVNYNMLFLGSDGDFMIPTEGYYYPQIEIFSYTDNAYKSTGHCYSNQAWCDPSVNGQITLKANTTNASLGSFYVFFNDKNFELTIDMEENINPEEYQNNGSDIAGDEVIEMISFKTPTYKTGTMNFTNVYGGNNAGGMTLTANVNVDTDGKASNVYGGGNEAVTDLTYVTLKGTVDNLYGGGNGSAAIVNKDTDVIIDGGIVNKNAYGGGNAAAVNGDTVITLVKGEIKTNLFASGNSAPTGVEDVDTSNSIVNIFSGTVHGSVYGGANTSEVNGYARVNIGKDTISDSRFDDYEYPMEIVIEGTIFGGGESKVEGDDDYDFRHISVTKGIYINIDGNNYTKMGLDGSIFGSGNASSSSGDSDIYIRNLGSADKVSTSTSIQRANNVRIINSYVQLLGTVDSTNKHSNLFSLNRIVNLYLLNDTELYLKNGANVLENYYSGTYDDQDNFVKEYATITDGVVDQNVDNKVYMFANKVLNILHTEDVIEDYAGNVNGMSFLGMYDTNAENEIVSRGIYSTTYKTGDVVKTDVAEVFKYSGTYVYGKHYTDHDITVDGYFSNYVDYDTNEITIDYVEVTPPKGKYYMWTLGVQISEFEIDLYASRYSTLGVKNLQLSGFGNPDTKFIVNDFRDNQLSSGVTIVDKDEVKKVADSSEIANTTFGLAMGTPDSGWKNSGFTSFSSTAPSLSGTENYEAASDDSTPALSFYLYHSKNVELEEDEDKRKLGYASIYLTAISPDPDDPLTSKVTTIEVKVNLYLQKFTEDGYSSTIAPGKKYSVFPYQKTDIASNGSLSIYHNLYLDLNGKDKNDEEWSYEKLYPEGAYRALVSDYVYPVGTTITMIDLIDNEYYYYTVTEENYAEKLAEYDNEVLYRLSDFIKMDSISSDNNYDDALHNSANTESNPYGYYHPGEGDDRGYAMEEFIFTVDFANAGITEDVTSRLYLELVDPNKDNTSIIAPLPSQGDRMKYNLYSDASTILDTSGSFTNDVVYIGEETTLDLSTTITQVEKDGVTVYDTTFDDYKLGVAISIYDENGNKVDGETLFGVSFTLNDKTYFPGSTDGIVRIDLAGKVANVDSTIIINTENSNLRSESYTMRIETFGSYDGLYNSNSNTDVLELSFTVLNNVFGLDVTSDDVAITHDLITGLDEEGNNVIDFTIEAESDLAMPNLRVSLQRRLYDEKYSLKYEKVSAEDFQKIFKEQLTVANESNGEFYIIEPSPSLPDTMPEFSLTVNEGSDTEHLKTGTYRIVFSMYDGDNFIGSVYRYLIIRDM